MSADSGANLLTVAGIPFIHEGGDGVQLPDRITPTWRGGRIVDAPIRVHHSVGDTSASGLEPLLDAPIALGEYYLDAADDVAIRSRATQLPGYRPQLLRTRRRGFDYAMRYEDPSDSLRLQWGWHRTIFMLALPLRARGLTVHAAGLLVSGGAGVLCPGISGAGKSTLARLLKTHAPDDVRVLGDDRIALTVESAGLHMWGTPWHSSAGTALADDGALGAIVFIAHGDGARLAPLPPGVALRRLLRAVGLPFWDRSGTDFALRLIERMIVEVPCFEFTYAPTPDAAAKLVDGMRSLPTSGR